MLEGLDAFVTSTMWAVIVLVGIWILGQLIGLINFK
jgi:hypothetical protein